MSTFIILITFTEQGVQSVKDSPRRAATFVQSVKSSGIETRGLYWTFGRFDGVIILDAPDERTAHAAVLSLAHAGNVKTETLRAYDSAGVGTLLAKLV
jgi:uncharacterized protein with GYD domain